jgi:hypothetical protein
MSDADSKRPLLRPAMADAVYEKLLRGRPADDQTTGVLLGGSNRQGGYMRQLWLGVLVGIVIGGAHRHRRATFIRRRWSGSV